MGHYIKWNIEVKSITGRDITDDIARFKIRLTELEFSETKLALVSLGGDCTRFYADFETFCLGAEQDVEQSLCKVSREFPDLAIIATASPEDGELPFRHAFVNGEQETVCAQLVWPEFKCLSFERREIS